MAPAIRGNSLYTIVDGPSWTQAETNSLKLGGHLATISDQLENQWIIARFQDVGISLTPDSRGVKNVFIGLTRADGTGPKFRNSAGYWDGWISGEASPYRPSYWGVGEGMDSDGYYSALVWGEGTWNDFPEWQHAGVGLAETPFIRRGDSAYVIVQGPTWEEAEANAVRLGGHLVTINDKKENEWLVNAFQDVNKGYSSNPANADIYWIGLTKASRTWKWASGEASDFILWGPNEPWEDNGVNDRAQIVLQSLSSDSSFWASTAGNWNNAPSNSLHYGIAEIKLAPNSVPTGIPTLTGTFRAGSALTLDPSTIKDTDNFAGYVPTYKYFWESSPDGTTWTALTSTDATDGNSTYTLTTAEDGKQIRGVVSYFDGYGSMEMLPSESGSTIKIPESGLRIFGRSIYIKSGEFWRDLAKNHAFRLGGNLAIVNSEAENQFIAKEFGLNSGEWGTSAFIGLSDEKSEGVWIWEGDDGERAEELYRRFAKGEPREDVYEKVYSPHREWAFLTPENSDAQSIANASGNGGWGWTTKKLIRIDQKTFDYAVINLDYSDEEFSTWRTTNSSGSQGAIIEIPFIRRGDSAYVIVQGPTWEEAEANAVKLGGHLVTIDDASENEWIYENFKNIGRSSLSKTAQNSVNNQTFGLWIGATDKLREGAWTDPEGNLLAYQNWGRDQPENATWYDPNGEDYASICFPDASLPDGGWRAKWGDLGGLPPNEDQAFSGIAEIRLAPNSPPAGAPRISGFLKAESILTIDASAIHDLDNFTGYALAYKYSWESSSDGIIWTALTSADATDGNSTYILTSAEVGKKIRGVVSFLDGYGTYEILPSAPLAIPTVIDKGDAVFVIEGVAKVGSTLSAAKKQDDPDGNESFSFEWQKSSDGLAWESIATSQILFMSTDYAGKQIRLMVSYVDGQANRELLPINAGIVANKLTEAILVNAPADLTTSEGGKAVTIEYRLQTQPTGPVKLLFALSDSAQGEASLSASSLSFATTNWSQTQSLTITGLDDFVVDGDKSYTLTVKVSSGDTKYSSLSPAPINLVNLDDTEDAGSDIYGDPGSRPTKDLLRGTKGPDRIYGLLSDDSLYGGVGSDKIYGGYGDDLIDGEAGNDDLYGEQDNDTLYGGEGDDRLTGGEGYDRLIGGPGNDTYVIDDERDVIDDQGTDKDVDTVLFRANLNTYTLPASIKNGVLDSGSAYKLIGNARDNELRGNDNANEIDGGDGNDALNGGGGNDILKGGSGSDTAYYGARLSGYMLDSAGGASIQANLLTGVATGDEIGTDTLIAIENLETADGSDMIIGNAESNRLIGNGGNDTIQSGDGDDILIGGPGNDSLDGGNGTQDQAIWGGKYADYKISYQANSDQLIIADQRNFQDGTDVVTGVELFKFADTTVSLIQLRSGDTASYGLDLDGDNQVTRDDSLLLMRSLLGTYPGDKLISGLTGSGAVKADTARQRFRQISSSPNALFGGRSILDLDGDNKIHPLTDGLLVGHYIHNQGFSDRTLNSDLIKNSGRDVGELHRQLQAVVGF